MYVIALELPHSILRKLEYYDAYAS